jgi:acetylornithine deacetylase/succinyl-diaminopimelate desuccinylase family protein
VTATVSNDPSTLLQALVRLPSVNPMGRPVQGPIYFEHQVTAYLEDCFRSLGVAYERQAVAPQRDNIVARLEVPGAKRTLLLEAHQDTVPVDGMTIDPFGGVIEQGRLYGRGACDIKSGMAAMLATFARLARDKTRATMNVTMACTVDEEHTFLGVQELVRRGVRADFAIIAEPTNLDIVNAHKGVARFVLTTYGRACHSSRPDRGINAVYRMGRVLTGIERFARTLELSRTDPILGPPTVSVGRIDGGVSVNTVPDMCRIEIDRRVIPGEDAAATAGELVRYLREQEKLDFEMECPAPWMSMPALGPQGSEELVALLAKAIHTVDGLHPVVSVPYGTDASIIARAGIPAVVFGPGDIAQAHTKDEWVSLEEVAKASEILFQFCTAD